MSDLISRQALTNALTNWQMEYAEKDKDVERFETLGAVIELVEQLPTVDPAENGGCWGCQCALLGQAPCTGCGFAQYATQEECDNCKERRKQYGNEDE